MNKYRIFIDLSADIDKDSFEKYNIGFVPMNYMVGEEEFLSDKILTDEELSYFYKQMANGAITKTSQITPYMYKDILNKCNSNNEDVLYFSLSSGLSNTYNNAIIVKEDLEDSNKDFKFMVVDSLGATGGIGLLAKIAGENLKNGMSLEDNYKFMNEIVKKSRYWFYVDDLKYLKRGGRVSASKCLIATTLNIKPIMTIDKNGKLDNIGKKLGKHQAAKALVNNYFETRDENYNTIFINHSNDIESAEYVKRLILERDSNVDIIISQFCPVIGSHTGPGTVAICHIGK